MNKPFNILSHEYIYTWFEQEQKDYEILLVMDNSMVTNRLTKAQLFFGLREATIKHIFKLWVPKHQREQAIIKLINP